MSADALLDVINVLAQGQCIYMEYKDRELTG